MKATLAGVTLAAAMFLPGAQAFRDSPVSAPAIGACTAEQLLGAVPEPDEVEAHRGAPLPVISYPFGTEQDLWGMELTLRVDEGGRVVCHGQLGAFGQPLNITPPRREALNAIWYAPFVRNGRAVPAIVKERVAEQELAETHVSLPSAPQDQIRISLERTGCYGSCPQYRVQVQGDGLVTYQGGEFVDVAGRHQFRVPRGEVTALIDSLRAKDLWSLRSGYRSGITDHPTYVLTFEIGGQVKQIEDYVGQMAGMPPLVTAFENEVDKVARTDKWIRISTESVDALAAEGFRFDSADGAEMLARAVANDEGKDDLAMARLIELGAPISGAEPSRYLLGSHGPSVLGDALRAQRVAVVQALIAEGALATNGKPDQAKIDAAFRDAIAGGSLALVRMIWDVPGAGVHPALTFDDKPEDGRPDDGKLAQGKRSAVSLLLTHPGWSKTERWEGLEIARWLELQGVDIHASRADGDTLLHIAAEADDARFVRYLLDRGLSASAPGTYGLPPLGSVGDEEVALLLLEAGTDMSQMGDFAGYARDQHWQRVVAWLKDHPAARPPRRGSADLGADRSSEPAPEPLADVSCKS
ncbi:DUF6438 domain-containing protein [Lysobacter sp. GCM10012299]|uniref:DUF6438 domain-containing protein n=1 Tax=Lysobacter sp. GCM10012299 TaxID=3317333 RepID=UPI00361C3AFF